MLLYIIFIIGTYILNKEVEAARKYDYTGCFDITDKSKILYQNAKKDEKLSPRSCVDFCYERQLAYAGLYKNECRCGQNQPSDLIRRSYRDCDYPCPGDKTFRCGGELKTSIYETGIAAKGEDAIPSKVYLGCYPDNDPKHKILPHLLDESEYAAVTFCQKICYREGFRYFGLSDNRKCWCGDSAPFPDKAVSEDNCRLICDGYGGDYCGGKSMLSLYATGILDIPEYGRHIGCYNNVNFKDIKTDLTMQLSKSNSNGRCMNLCDQKGFKYAGTQRGSQCFCMNKPPSATFRGDDSKCDDAPCSGEPTSTCGSNDGMKIFRTRRTDEIQPVVVRYLGCFSDQKVFPTMEGTKVTVEKKLTSSYCIETCRLKGYAFSGVESGTDCYCSHAFPSIHMKVRDEECNIPCSGNRTEYCGGQFKIGVYDNGMPHPHAFVHYSYTGCYKDDEIGVKLMEGTMEDMANLTPSVCHKHCLQAGFLYFGLTMLSDSSERCLCSDQEPQEQLHTSDSDCQKKCSGDPTKMCGNDWRVAVYRTGLSDNEHVYEGCYQNDGNLLIDKQYSLTKSITPKRCQRFCDLLGYKYSGVEEGKTCRCGTEFPSHVTRKSQSDCHIRCLGDFAETCGGHRKHVQVYRVTSQPGENAEQSSEPIFYDNFEKMDTSVWGYSIKVASDPDYEFVSYERCHHVVAIADNADILHLKPKIQPYEYSDTSFGTQSCTRIKNGVDCSKKPENNYILPPLQAGQIHTKNSFSFKYGKVEVQAKMPMGDWIVPQIWLMPTKNEYGKNYLSGQIRIAMARGNEKFECSNVNHGYQRVEMGVYIGPDYDVKQKIFYKTVPEGWADKFHNYTTIWLPDKISFLIDDEEIGTIQPGSGQTIRQILGTPQDIEYVYRNSANKMAPFDKEFHLSLGLHVGGIRDFPDNCISTPKKPWSNSSPQSMLDFWKDNKQWFKTWKGTNAALQIEQIKVWAL
ncbi:uncharacterized protein LOC135849377 isoform X2 [Planococcus citri]|uniref:uncharacterized protein LOC135849377 isoform X2 n=1 Tax=Planococcus citri TaxID=170843 RepID=UPI0031F7CD3E